MFKLFCLISFWMNSGLLLSVVCLVIFTVVLLLSRSLAAVVSRSGGGVGAREFWGAGCGLGVTFSAAVVEPALAVGRVFFLRRDLAFCQSWSTSPSDSFEPSEEADSLVV